MELLLQSFNNLKKYCEEENFKGWDPYDGLNSKVFRFLQMHRNSFLRLAWIQFFKRSPVNFRRIALVEKDYNPKGLGLFLSSYCNLYKLESKSEYIPKIKCLADKIIELQTHGFSGVCWGYNFDWQSRAFFLKKGTPTIVVTSFISYSLMDAYDCTGDKKYLEAALSSCEFIMNDLNRTSKPKGFIFSYSPFDKTCVYNASFLGSRLLSRAYNYSKNKLHLEAARESLIACTEAQRSDGAWVYGELDIQNWVDSFHTGYNLECISEYQKYSGDDSFSKNLELGLKYYIKNFFLDDGTPKYYDNKIFPIDIHAPAQFIVTLFRLKKFEENRGLIDKTLYWTIANMQDKKYGYFYYQLNQRTSSKIPYMRWAQAWIMLAISFYLLESKKLKEIL